MIQERSSRVADQLTREMLKPERRVDVLWIPAVSLVPVFNLLILRGWREEVLERLAAGAEDPIPGPELGQFLKRGTKSWLVSLAFAALPAGLFLVLFPDILLMFVDLWKLVIAGPAAWNLMMHSLALLAGEVGREPLTWAAQVPWQDLMLAGAVFIALAGLAMFVDHLSAACSASLGSSRFAVLSFLRPAARHPNQVLKGLGLRFAILGGLTAATAFSFLAGPAVLLPLMFGPACYYFLTSMALGELARCLASGPTSES